MRHQENPICLENLFPITGKLVAVLMTIDWPSVEIQKSQVPIVCKPVSYWYSEIRMETSTDQTYSIRNRTTDPVFER